MYINYISLNVRFAEKCRLRRRAAMMNLPTTVVYLLDAVYHHSFIMSGVWQNNRVHRSLLTRQVVLDAVLNPVW